MHSCLNAIGSEDPTAGPNESDKQKLREALKQEFNENPAVDEKATDTLLQADLIWSVARAMGC